MKTLAILGASGHGKVAAEIALALGWQQIDFYDVNWLNEKNLCKWKVIGDEKSFFLKAKEYDATFVAIGNNSARKQKLEALFKTSNNVVNLISPSAIISTYVEIGLGNLVANGACINIDSKLGNGVIINTAATIDHDCCISDYVHICPGVHIAGNVSIGKNSWIGIGSTIIQNLTIGSNSIVGAGSVAIRNLPSDITAVGVPTKIIKGKTN